ncbi:ABC transporter ATP-binding protein [Candidatus Saccharibacteria bacterium]|nr:ABC transporter ATP-binding protein [Candidatus Saccharibacteria bacterium]
MIKTTNQTKSQVKKQVKATPTSATLNIPLISVKNLTVKYGAATIISHATFDINPEDFICVVGANGSGKSTLVRTLLGLIRPASGKIKYAPGFKNTAIGYLPQEAAVDRAFPATVFEIVLSGSLGRLGARPFYTEAARIAALGSLDTLGISDLKHQNFSSLSGGQKQKVLLARALNATSRLLILDEPSNNLDHHSRRDFYDLLKSLNQDRHLTIIMITHDLDADDLIGSQVLSLKDGAVELQQTADFLRSYQ